MGDDADKELKIKILTTADTQSVEDYNAEIRKLGAGVDDNSEKMRRNAAEATHSSGAHWELRRAFEQLSQIIPGLGPVSGLVGEGFRDMGEGAMIASAGIDELITTLGPVAIVILSIQAAVEMWDAFIKSSEDASRAAAKAFKDIEDESRKALEAYEKLQDAISGKKDQTHTYEDELRDRKAVLEAQQKVQEDVAKAREQQELDAAGRNEVAKAEIQQRYEKEAQQRKITFAQQDIDLQNQVLKKARETQRVNQVHLSTLIDLSAGAVPGSAYQLSLLKNIATQSNANTSLQEFIDHTQEDVGREGLVNAVNQGGVNTVNKINQRGTFETGVRSALGDFGPKLDAKQQAALQEVQALFQSVHGNMDTWLSYLKQFHLTNDQKMAAIDSELAALQQRLGSVSNGTAARIQ